MIYYAKGGVAKVMRPFQFLDPSIFGTCDAVSPRIEKNELTMVSTTNLCHFQF